MSGFGALVAGAYPWRRPRGRKAKVEWHRKKHPDAVTESPWDVVCIECNVQWVKR